MPKELEDVIKFNKEIIGLKPVEYLNDERLKWFNTVIKEELNEFNAANSKYFEYKEVNKPSLYPQEDALLEVKADMLDAIIDLIYYALGRFYEIGGTSEDFDCIWEAVQRANMNKKKGNKGRGSDDDAIKPEGWQSPEETYIAFKKCQRNNQEFIQADTKSIGEFNHSTYIPIYKKELEVANRPNTSAIYGPSQAITEQSIRKSAFDHLLNNIKSDYKYDNGKPNLAVVFGGFPKALKDVGHIGTFGAHKYLPYSWKTVDNLQERYMSALMRHVLEILDKNEFDNETGRHHLGHIAWNAMALLEDKFDNSIEYEAYNEKALATTKATLAKYKELKNEQTNK